MTTLQVKVASGTEDGYTDTDTNFDSTAIGQQLASATRRSWYRFLLAVPQGASITSATLTVYRSTSKGSTVSVSVAADDVDNSATPTTGTNFNARTFTTATSTSTGLGATDSAQALACTAQIQAIVNRAGWVSGNAVLLACSAASNAIAVRTYDSGVSASYPTLTVDYTAGGGGSPVSATGSAPLGGLVTTAAGTPKVTASGSAPLGSLTAQATGTRKVIAAAAAALGALTATATAVRRVPAAVSAPLGALSASAAGTVTAENITAAATAPLGGLTATSTASRTITGSASAPLGGVTATAAGTVTAEVVTASASAPLGPLAVSSTGGPPIAGAVRFDAASDRITYTGALPDPATTGITITGWVSLAVDRDDYSTIWRLASPGGSGRGQLVGDADGTTIAHYAGSVLTTDQELVVDQWTRVAVTADASGLDVLVAHGADGPTDVTTGSSSGMADPAAITLAGVSPSNAAEPGNLRLAHVRIWSGKRSQAHVEAEWRSSTPVTTSGLWADWPLGSADDLTDHSGNGRHLTAGTTPVTTADGPPVSDAPPTVEGAVAAPLGSLTATAAASVRHPGVANAPLGSLSAAAAGEVTAEIVTAAVNANLGGLDASAAAQRTTLGVVSSPLGGLAVSATAVTVHSAQAQAPLGALTAASTPTRTTNGAAAAPLGPLTTSAGAGTSTPGTATAPLGPLIAAVDGTTQGSALVTAPLGGLTAAAAGQLTHPATVVADLGRLVAAAGGTTSRGAVATAPLGKLTAAGIIRVAVMGAATAVLGGLEVVAGGNVRGPATAPPPTEHRHAGAPIWGGRRLAVGVPVLAGPGLRAGQPTRTRDWPR